MFQFCFNDCLPKNSSDHDLSNSLNKTLSEFVAIKKEFPNSVVGVVLHTLPASLVLNDTGTTLKQCISGLTRELRIIAFSVFNKYPIDDHFNIINEDELIDGNYITVINKLSFNAINVKIVSDNNGVLFTLAVHDDLMTNTVLIRDKDGNDFEANNLFGHPDNTTHICNLITSEEQSKQGNFDKLKALITNCTHGPKFKTEFDNLSEQTQTILLREFKKAVDRNAVTPFSPDGTLIKDVTPSCERKLRISELRVFSPVAIRVYFSETTDGVVFGSIDLKPKKKVQTNDILKATSIINELLSVKK